MKFEEREIMRRSSVFLVLALLTGLVLTACGDSPTATVPATTSAVATTQVAGTTSAATSATTAASSAGALSVTDNTNKTVTVQQSATRIACLSIECIDILKELGVVPLAVQHTLFTMNSIFQPQKIFGEQAAAGIGKLRPNSFQYNLEELAQLKPDLIIGTSQAVQASNLTLLGVAVYALDYSGYAQAIENLKNIGKLTGRTAQANAAAQKFTGKLAAYKAKAPRDKSAMIISSISDNRFQVNHVGTPSCALLNELAKCPWKSPIDAKGGTVPYSLEQLLSDDPDFIFIRQRTDEKSVQLLNEMKSSPIWKELKAVKSGKVYEGDFYVLSQSMGTYLLNEFLDYTMTMMYPAVFPKTLP
jgi:iron complex transport system substrate-binding protein